MKARFALFCGLVLTGANALAACYTVYDARDRVIYQGVEAPVDMSLPLHETLGRRLPGAHMVFDTSTTCTPVALPQVARSSAPDAAPNTIRRERPGRIISPNSSAPLLTDVVTAERRGLPHTVVAGNIAVVPARAAARVDLPTFTVVPSDTALARAPAAPDTTALGAGPAPRGAVITELRDGSTVIQRGDGRK